jgi:hypothetical protein
MVALGNEGPTPRWYGPSLENGIHLRWAFRTSRGFPSHGFVVSRRPHRPGTLAELPAASLHTASIRLPQAARRIVLRVSAPSSPRPRARAVTIEARFRGVPVTAGQIESAGGRRTPMSLALEADAIDELRVGRGVNVSSVRYVPVSQDAERGWQEITRLCLPLTSPTYPCRSGPPSADADWQIARERIPASVVSTYLGAVAGVDNAHWMGLYQAMTSLFGPPIHARLELSPLRLSDPSATIAPGEMLLLASVDPYVARILGLAWVDGTAQAGQRYDYRVVGTWDKGQLKAAEVSVDFDADAPGRVLPHTFVRDVVIVRSAHRGTVISVTGAPWGDTRHALDLGTVTAGAPAGQPPYLRLQLPAPAGEVQLYFEVHDGEPVLSTSTVPTVTARWASADGRFRIATLAAQNPSDRIADVVVRPAVDHGPLHLAVCKIGLLSEWSPPMSEPLAWICYDISAAPPPSLLAPSGLHAAGLPTPTRELEDGSVASGPRAGLTWTIATSNGAILPREPVRYVMERQSLGSGATPSAASEDAWQRIHAPSPPGTPPDVPVTVSGGEMEAPYLYVDDPAVALGQAEADRFYSYRVAGVDLFGRLGDSSPPSLCDMTDVDGPPPPVAVEAKYLDPLDPTLTDDERSLVDGDPPASGVQLRWRWSPDRRRQAPDAREFRVYLQPGRINAITGTILSVAPAGGGNFVVSTDCTLPATAVDAFTGEMLANAGVNFMVVHNTAGAGVTFIVRPPAAPPPVVPILGLCTLSISGPRPISGTIVSAVPHLDGTVTLLTDRSMALAVNALAEKRLAQGGRTFTIVQSTSGRPLRLTVRGAGGIPPRAPHAGAFAVLDSTGPGGRAAPVLEAPGNPLYVDYRSADAWEQRVAVELLSDTDVYSVFVPYALMPPPGMAMAYAQLAVSSADDKDYAADSPLRNGTPLGGRRGNEGMLSAPVLVQSTRRLAPPRPAPPDVGTGLATAADYYGNSTILVRWTAAPGLRVQVYRAADAAIVTSDRLARPSRSTGREDYPWLSDAEFTALVSTTPDYAALSDVQLQALASLPGNDEAFGLLTPEPLSIDSYTATFNGRVKNRHCFAILLVDAAGNRSSLGLPSRPVHAPRVTLPATPAFSKVLGGDRKVTLSWLITRDADVAEYRVYRAESQAAAQRLETMNLLHSVPLAVNPMTRPTETAFVDAPLPGLRTCYYRLTAVDEAGNVSGASAIAYGRPFDETVPEVPTPIASWVADPTGGGWRSRVSWSSPNETILQQRLADTGAWQSITAWRSAGDHTVVDDTAERSRSYHYRLWARSTTGAIAIGVPMVLPGAG